MKHVKTALFTLIGPFCGLGLAGVISLACENPYLKQSAFLTQLGTFQGISAMVQAGNMSMLPAMVGAATPLYDGTIAPGTCEGWRLAVFAWGMGSIFFVTYVSKNSKKKLTVKIFKFSDEPSTILGASNPNSPQRPKRPLSFLAVGVCKAFGVHPRPYRYWVHIRQFLFEL